MKRLSILLLIVLGSWTQLHSQTLIETDTICYGIADLRILAQNNIERQHYKANCILLDSIIGTKDKIISNLNNELFVYTTVLERNDSTIQTLQDYNLYLQNNNKVMARNIKLQLYTSLLILVVCLL